MGLEMLILIAATAVFGISSISLNEILFQSLIEFGCGIAILSAILYTVARIFRSDELGRVTSRPITRTIRIWRFNCRFSEWMVLYKCRYHSQ